jgi:hypothetical protein
MSTHTATPWVANERYVGVPNHKSFIAECRDQNGIWSNQPMSLANAAFIVRACNAHDDLVKALQSALPYMKYPRTASDALVRAHDAAIEAARDALAKAGAA